MKASYFGLPGVLNRTSHNLIEEFMDPFMEGNLGFPAKIQLVFLKSDQLSNDRHAESRNFRD